MRQFEVNEIYYNYWCHDGGWYEGYEFYKVISINGDRIKLQYIGEITRCDADKSEPRLIMSEGTPFNRKIRVTDVGQIVRTDRGYQRHLMPDYDYIDRLVNKRWCIINSSAILTTEQINQLRGIK